MRKLLARVMKAPRKVSRRLRSRCILLGEHLPLRDELVVPSRRYLANTDSLLRAAYRFRTDAQGFILPAGGHAQPQITLVFLGGSTTECFFVEEEDRVACRLGRMLEASLGKKVNSYNAGVSYNTTLHSLDILIHKALPLSPTCAFLMQTVNDLNALLCGSSYWGSNPLRNRLMSRRFSFYDPLPPELEKRTQKAASVSLEAMTASFRQGLMSFIALCRVYGVIPVLMTEHNRLTAAPDEIIKKAIEVSCAGIGVSYLQYKEMYDAFNQVVRATAGQENVALIDLARLIPQDKKYMYDMVHLNSVGSRYVADTILPQLTMLRTPSGR